MGVSRDYSHRLIRYAAVLLLLFVSPTYAESVTLPVWLNNQVYTLSLESHTVKGLAQEDSNHYKGHIQGVNRSWARVSEFNNRWEGVVSLNGELFVIDIANSTDARALQSNVVRGKPASEYAEIGACEQLNSNNTDSNKTSNPLAMSLNIAQAASFNTLCNSKVDGICLLAEIEFVFDHLFQNTFPNDYQSKAAQLINIIEGYYENDLSIGFQTLSTTFLTQQVFSSTTNSGSFLNDISQKKRDGELDFVSKNEALLHVVTGKDFDGGTVGIAWLSGLCDTNGQFSAGTTQVVNSSIPLTALVAAHEIGHNLGASHDGEESGNSCNSSGFIMAPTLDPSVTEFSTCSVNYIESTIGNQNNQDACFDYPFDIEITSTNSSNAIVTSSTTRTFQIDTAVASRAVSQASISGAINSGSGSFTSVTIDNTTCTISGDGQSYTCTLNSPATNHTLSATLSVATGSFNVSHSVAVNQSELAETDNTNNSATDVFTVLLGDGGGDGDNNDSDDSDSTNNNESSTADESNTSSSGGGGGGGGSFGLFTLLPLLLLGTMARYKKRRQH